MNNIIVYIDDVTYAQQQLVPMRDVEPTNQSVHWILVACAPRMTRYVGKWMTHSTRTHWRQQWSDKLFAQVDSWIQAPGDRVTHVVAAGPLVEQTSKLMKDLGHARVWDARRPKFGHDLQPVTDNQPPATEGRWTLPGAVAGMGAVLVLAAE